MENAVQKEEVYDKAVVKAKMDAISMENVVQKEVYEKGVVEEEIDAISIDTIKDNALHQGEAYEEIAFQADMQMISMENIVQKEEVHEKAVGKAVIDAISIDTIKDKALHHQGEAYEEIAFKADMQMNSMEHIKYKNAQQEKTLQLEHADEEAEVVTEEEDTDTEDEFELPEEEDTDAEVEILLPEVVAVEVAVEVPVEVPVEVAQEVAGEEFYEDDAAVGEDEFQWTESEEEAPMGKGDMYCGSWHYLVD